MVVMNTNPNDIRVLIYGDSLSWGAISGSKTFERYPLIFVGLDIYKKNLVMSIQLLKNAFVHVLLIAMIYSPPKTK